MQFTLRNIIFLSLTPIVINGCSSPHQENFKCPAGPGYSCKSLSYVHEQIQQGAFHESPEDTTIYLPPQPEGN